MKKHGEIRGRIGSPIEIETADGLVGDGSEVDGEGLGGVCKIRLPFRTSRAIDCADGELSGLEIVRRGDRTTLCYIAVYSSDVCDPAIRECEGAVGGKLVGCTSVVTDLDGDGGVTVGHIGCCIRVRETGYGSVGLIGNSGYGPALPVDSSVA